MKLHKPLLFALIFFTANVITATIQRVSVAANSAKLTILGVKGQHYAINAASSLERLETASGTDYISNGRVEEITLAYNTNSPIFFQSIDTATFSDLDVITASPIPRFRQPPSYPYSLLLLGIEGEVVLDFTILADGSVSDIVPVSYTHSYFYDSAVQVVQNWLYEPPVFDENATGHHTRIFIPFQIN